MPAGTRMQSNFLLLAIAATSPPDVIQITVTVWYYIFSK